MIRIYPGFIAMLALLLSTSAFAGKCKFREDDSDMFSGSKTVRTKWNPIVTGWVGGGEETTGSSVSAISEGGKQYLGLRFDHHERFRSEPSQEDHDKLLAVPAGSTLHITMADGSMVELPASQDAEIESEISLLEPHPLVSNRFSITSAVTLRYELVGDTADTLMAQSAASVRVTNVSGDIDIAIHRSSVDDIKKSIECIR